MPAQASKPIAYPSLHEQSPGFPPVDWLWPAWIPNGMLTLLGAAPGVGKSLVALDLARRIIHDEPFPDGAPVPCPGRNVLIVDAEGPPALLNHRALAWDIDSRRLFLMPPPDRTGFFDLVQPEQMNLLSRMVVNIRPALVIVDSLAAATARAETSLQLAHALLGGLAALARGGRMALLVIHHLRKPTASGWSPAAPRTAAGDLRGTSHLGAAARSILGLTPLDGLRRLEVLKSNLCRLPPPLALTFEGESGSVPTLHYCEYVEPPPPPTQIDLCARWLLDYLAATGAPAKPLDVVRAAAAEGFPPATVYRARKALPDLVVDLGNSLYDPNKRWTLAPPDPPAGEEPADQDTTS